MIILMNCLTDAPDEGGVKLANHLARVIKAARPDTKVVSYATDSRCLIWEKTCRRRTWWRRLFGKISD